MDINEDKVYLEIAKKISQFSKAERRKVGSLIVNRFGKIVATGYNGTPKGVDNQCEDNDGKTFDYVIHSEINAILNATTHDLEGSTIYVTLSPCRACAGALIQKGFKKVVYDEEYRCTSGIEFLRKHGIEVKQIQLKDDTH